MSHLLEKAGVLLDLVIRLLTVLVAEAERSAPTEAPEPASEPTPPSDPAPIDVNSTPVPPSPEPAPALDADGIPWDARIHSGSRNTTADGRWRRLRGVDKGLYATVYGELRAARAAPMADTPVPPAPPPPSADTPTPMADTPVPPAPPPPSADTPAPTADTPTPPAITTFVELMEAAMKAGKDYNDVAAAAKEHGLDNPANLNMADHQSLIPSVAATMGLAA